MSPNQLVITVASLAGILWACKYILWLGGAIPYCS